MEPRLSCRLPFGLVNGHSCGVSAHLRANPRRKHGRLANPHRTNPSLFSGKHIGPPIACLPTSAVPRQSRLAPRQHHGTVEGDRIPRPQPRRSGESLLTSSTDWALRAGTASRHGCRRVEGTSAFAHVHSKKSLETTPSVGFLGLPSHPSLGLFLFAQWLESLLAWVPSVR